jgi:Tfp pilus assembly protein PilN
MVEIIPKEAPRPSKGLSALFYFAIFLLFLSAGGYFVLNNFLQKAESDLSSLKLEVSQIMTPEKTALEQEILTSKGEIDNFSSLVDQHLEPSVIFSIIQRVTHPQVWFTSLDFDPVQKVFEVSGETQSFESLGQQILIMEGEETIDTVDLKTVSISKEGGIEFDMSLSLKADVF